MPEIHQYQNRPFTEPWNSMTELRYAQQVAQVNTCVTLNDEIGEMPGIPDDQCDYCGHTHDHSAFDCWLDWREMEDYEPEFDYL